VTLMRRPTAEQVMAAWEKARQDPKNGWYGRNPDGTLKPCTLKYAQAVFKKWLGAGYDQDALCAVLAAASVERLDGDPLWLLVISGNAKTETVQALTGAGEVLTSSIASEGALLSGTSNKERAKDATGGLLRQMGERGVLAIKDVTTILAMSGDARDKVLSGLREVYDGKWFRDIGVDGGRRLTWEGRLAVVGAVTTAWDTHQSVIAMMGDRFVLVRMDSNGKRSRVSAGRQAIGNTGSEIQMRQELSDAAGGVIAGMSIDPLEITDEEQDALLSAADSVTRARTAVEMDRGGNITDSHAPEMPTRFAKQLWQVVRGAVAIGVPRQDALRLAIRCARDSMPPLRLAIIDDLSKKPDSSPSDVRRRLNKPWHTVDRQLQALHMLEVLDCDEVAYGDQGKSRWLYSLADGIHPDVLNPDVWLETSPVSAVPPYKDTSESDTSNFPSVHTAEFGEVLEGDSDGSGAANDHNPQASLVESAAATCQTEGCGRQLMAPHSRQRGICESCYVHGPQKGTRA
jgi:hypothetical protein